MNPRLLRHSLAGNLLARGAGLIMIRDQPGHAFVESTMIYAHTMATRTRVDYDFLKSALPYATSGFTMTPKPRVHGNGSRPSMMKMAVR